MQRLLVGSANLLSVKVHVLMHVLLVVYPYKPLGHLATQELLVKREKVPFGQNFTHVPLVVLPAGIYENI